MTAHSAGRDYFRTYRVQRRAERDFVLDAVERAGARVISVTEPTLAPLHLVVQERDGVRVGALLYLFSAGHQEIRNRPSDEHRLQIKYGDITEEWRQQDHAVGFDPTGLEVTVILAAHRHAGVFIGLDPAAFDPLPMGIQVGFKDVEVVAARRSGWHVWERSSQPGRRREARSGVGLDTLVAFKPERLLDYIAFERYCRTLSLDPALRYRAAEAASAQRASLRVHDLERAYRLSALEILEIVSERSRLAMAVRGGVAEHHLGRQLAADPAVEQVRAGQQEGPPDFFVTLRDGRVVTVECKNASPRTYADGTAKVEVQKTRTSRADPLSRLYPRDAFDIVAACMYGPTNEWKFRYCRTAHLSVHPAHSERIAPVQAINEAWAGSLTDVLIP